MAADPNLTAMYSLTREEASEAEVLRREMGRALISQWRLNRALYQQYGGRVIYQQLGPEPLDAYRQYLEERLANGDFTIHEKVFEKGFWHYFNDDYTDKSLLNYSFTMGCQLAFTLRGILERFN